MHLCIVPIILSLNFFLATAINDGVEHSVYLRADGDNAKLYIDNELKDNKSDGVVSDLGKFNGKKLHVALYGESYLQPYEGCLSGIVFGDVEITLTSNNSANTLDSCVSSRLFCPSQPCVKGACIEDFNDFECQCSEFYTQKTCNETIDVNCTFSNDLCNNGTCSNNPSSTTKEFSDNGFDKFECNCNEGFNGTRCNIVTDECEPNPCLNNGTCEDKHLGYYCHCTAEYYGSTCKALFINSCNELKPCMNGATCGNNATAYTCQCTDGYTGKNCSEKLKEDDDDNLPLILGLSITAVVIVLIIIIVCVVVFCRNKSGMEGTYSPNKEEQTAGNLEMSTVKKPKTERLI